MLKISNFHNIQLTPRDIEMFWILGKVGYLSLNHLSELLWSKRYSTSRKVSCSRRVLILQESNYVDSIEVPILTREKFIRIGKEASRLLRQIGVESNESKKEVIKSTFVHDEYVTKILAKFYKSGAKNFFTERELIALDSKRAHYPDILFSNDKDHQVLVEIELEQKTKDRIYNKVYDFINRPDVRHVLFFTPLNSVKEYLSVLKQELKKGDKIQFFDLFEAIENERSLSPYIEAASSNKKPIKFI